MPADVMTLAPRLRWIQSWSAGVDWLLEHEAFDPSAHPDLVVTSASGVHAVPVAEHVVAVQVAEVLDDQLIRHLCHFGMPARQGLVHQRAIQHQ